MPRRTDQRSGPLIVASAVFLSLATDLSCQTSTPRTPEGVQEVQRSSVPGQRIPQQRQILTSALQGIVLDADDRPLAGVSVQLLGRASSNSAQTTGDGVFRLLQMPPGNYDLTFSNGGEQAYVRRDVELNAGEVLSIKVHLLTFGNPPGRMPIAQQPTELNGEGQYPTISQRPDSNGVVVVAKELELPPDSRVYSPQPDRWQVGMPHYHRYAENLEAPFILGHWYDPFNRNNLKGDIPIKGQKTFFSFTADSITALDGRRLPTPSGQSTADPNQPGFFGRGGQFFLAQTFRFTFDLFHGDTNAFRPVDWRIRITPAANLNYIHAQENQVISPDVRAGTSRIDGHVGLQEAFGEVKLRNLGPNFDFVNLRAGVQQFVSDFRGLIFVDEQPGVRLFGNLRSNRLQYNFAGFDLLEKNTNSGLNTLSRRYREVAIANIFIQDFFIKGYTAQFSYHFQRDQATLHYDDNGFLVRPAPIGTVSCGNIFASCSVSDIALVHRIDSHYIGWTGDGHIGRTNINHAFYQVFGDDTLNPLAGHKVDINARLAEVELSQDRDWMRYRISFLYASGEKNPVGRTAHGFDSIVDAESFAGGEFSFFNRESIRLTSTGVALNPADSFLPDLRASKDEGQSNFVNPGIFLYNAGVDSKLTQNIKLIGNVSFLQFSRTEPLTFLLQQSDIRRAIGVDSSIGVLYRPLLSDNIVITVGTAVLAPGQGLRDISNSQTLISTFGTVRFQF
jgi:hypothetical protein